VTARPRVGSTRTLIVLAVVGFALTVRIVVAASVLVRASSDPVSEDYVGRFGEIAVAEGRPYRDHPVEYPPVSLAAIELVGDADPGATGVRLVWFSLAADAVVVAALGWAWGGVAVATYLLASLPVLGALFTTLDLLPTALAVAALALARKRRERSGGVLLAAAALAKLWPLVVMPGLFVRGRRRALAWSVAALAVGSLAWVLWAGTGALGQVATQRHSPGWESESTVGALVRVIGDEPVRIVKDSPRVGTAPGWAKALLLAAMVAGVGAVWRRASRDGGDEIGAPSLAAVGVLLFLSPIYSYPYIVWLLPWAAVAMAEGRRDLAIIGFGVEAITTLAYVLLKAGDAGAGVGVYLVLIARDLLTGAIPAAYLLSGRRVSSRAGARAPAGT
jgi:alpha-1,2-mannosyltransferase